MNYPQGLYTVISLTKVYLPARPGTVRMRRRGASQERPMMTAGPTPSRDIKPVTRGSPDNEMCHSRIVRPFSSYRQPCSLQQSSGRRPDWLPLLCPGRQDSRCPWRGSFQSRDWSQASPDLFSHGGDVEEESVSRGRNADTFKARDGDGGEVSGVEGGRGHC